ncbi:MAG: dihydropteroate synthase [Chloroflexi bacterium]|nr:dihydropteroate synthase [Chloroflexota bacterium]MBU1749816.1 dihydropteroate synthase [Chloroflexota bacterium]MBU1880208.1 dihydropteroate synthase [Chloroflexota bacterium]
MYIIGENIHIISSKVKAAVLKRDAQYLQELAKAQVDHGASMLDLNIGPQKKHGHELMPWLIDVVQEVAPGFPISLDTTNANAIEAGLKRCQELGIEALINSTTADPDRIALAMPLAAKYNAKIVALTLGKTGMPTTADARVELAMQLIAAADEYGIPYDHLYLDPLVLTVKGTQEHAPETLNAVRMFKMLVEPAPMSTVGLSNISNQVPEEGRGLINRTFLVMLMAAGLDTAIADPMDEAQNEFIRIVEERDESTGVGRLLVALYDNVMAMEPFNPDVVDMDDPAQSDIYKTIRVLENQGIFADSYLRL